MKSVWLGIRDYCRDCWHDFIRKEAIKRYGWNIRNAIGYYRNGKVKFIGVPVWKEGNLWHYIQNSRIRSKRAKNA